MAGIKAVLDALYDLVSQNDPPSWPQISPQLTHNPEMLHSDPLDQKRWRRFLAQKWSQRAFWSSVIMMVLLVTANSLLAPLFHKFINLKPSRFRQRTFALPWVNMSMAMWTVVILALSFLENRGDLTGVTKRLGRISVSLMPPLYLLTLRPSPLPRTYYLQVMPMHKWLSRVVVALAASHGLLYVYVYAMQGSLVKLTQLANIYGFIALGLFVGMAVTGWQRFRRRFYEVFYGLHVLGLWCVIPLVAYHSRPPSNSYMCMCLALVAYQVFARILGSTTIKLRVQNVTPTLLLVDIPKTTLPPAFWHWSPAAHVRLSGLLKNPLTWVSSSHPYTIASLPDDPTLRLVIRPGDYKISMRREYALFGPHRALPPYLMSQVADKMIRRTLLIIGGSGIAFGAPMMRYLRLNGSDVRMIWAIRDPCDARVLPQIGLHDDVMAGSVEIFYTGEPARLGDENLTVTMSDDCCNDTATEQSQRRSLSENSSAQHQVVRGDPILKQYMHVMYNERAHLNLRLKSWLYGYENSLDDAECCCADRLIDSCDEDRLGAWVLSSGGPTLMETAREWAQLSGVCFFQDSFTL